MSGDPLVFNIARFSLADGPGIRTVVYLKGCPLSCAWCHNPEGIDAAVAVYPRPERCVACGACAPVCPRMAGSAATAAVVSEAAAPEAAPIAPEPSADCPAGCDACAAACLHGARERVGTAFGIDDLLAEVEADRSFYRVSGGGVTLSGGEPLAHPDFTLRFLRACAERGIHTAVETSGQASESAFRAVAALADLILLDIKLMDPEAHRRWTGSDNARIRANARLAARSRADLRIRRPFIPGVNDSPEETAALGMFVVSLNAMRASSGSGGGPVGIDLLPYHADAEGKYARWKKRYELAGLGRPSDESVAAAASALSKYGISVRTGG